MSSKKQTVVAIVQARMGSSRLPGKVLMKVCGRTMLEWVVQRAGTASLIDAIVVATTTDESDNVLVKFCDEKKISCQRGSPQDVLDRYYKTAQIFQADIIVRLTADCPLLDGKLIDEVIKPVLDGSVDFCANRLPPPFKRTVPIGLDVECVRFESLECAWREAVLPYEREHVLPYVYTHPEKFRLRVINFQEDLGDRRWTVDTPEDLVFIQSLMDALSCRENVSWREIESVIQQRPELLSINANVQHKTFLDVDERSVKKNT